MYSRSSYTVGLETMSIASGTQVAIVGASRFVPQTASSRRNPKKRILPTLSVDELYDLSCTLSIPPELSQSLCRFAREFSFPEDAKRAMSSKYSLCKAILLHV